MSYRFSRIDGNQVAIAAALVAAGCTVDHVSRRPYDLVVGHAGRSYLLEVKNPAKPKADRQLSPAQVKFASAWGGHWAKVESAQEALAAVGLWHPA